MTQTHTDTFKQQPGSELELLLYPHIEPRNQRRAVITDDHDSTPNLEHMGFTNSLSQRSNLQDVYKDPYASQKSRVRANFWDAEHFTSVDNKLPIYPRRKGFVSFDSMSPRKPLQTLNCNESRFLSKELFPSQSSSVRHNPRVIFNKQMPRDNRFMSVVTMSDSLYSSEMLNLTKPRVKGIL
jgi:hypothetical protein